jgi:hypothetical protein
MRELGSGSLSRELLDEKVDTAVEAPARLVPARLLELAGAHHRYAVGRHASRDEITLHRVGPALSEHQVVVLGAARIRGAAERDGLIGVGLEPRGIRVQDVDPLCDSGAVETKWRPAVLVSPYSSRRIEAARRSPPKSLIDSAERAVRVAACSGE